MCQHKHVRRSEMKLVNKGEYLREEQYKMLYHLAEKEFNNCRKIFELDLKDSYKQHGAYKDMSYDEAYEEEKEVFIGEIMMALEEELHYTKASEHSIKGAKVFKKYWKREHEIRKAETITEHIQECRWCRQKYIAYIAAIYPKSEDIIYSLGRQFAY